MTVLVVEDDVAIRRLLVEQLAKRGFSVTCAATSAEARAVMRKDTFSIVILDVALPDGSGLDVLADLRRTGGGGHVIVLSGAATEAHRVHALSLGADDYVVKPFYIRELIARVLAVRRRAARKEDSRLQVGHLEIDTAAREVRSSGRTVDLTMKEFDLLAFMAARPGHVFSRDELLRAVWRSARDLPQAATVNEHIHRLRAKVEAVAHQPRLLRTVRGVGYRLDLPPDARSPDAVEPHAPPVVASLVHVEGRIVSADTGATALLGWEEAELLGRLITDLTVPAWSAASQDRLRRLASGQPVRSQLWVVRHRDGTEVSVEVSNSPTVWNGVPACGGTLTPAPEPSMQLRHLVTGIVTEVADAVIITDLRFHIRSWNRGAERLYGWAEREVLGRHILDIVEWAGDDLELAAAWETLETTGRWHGEGRQLTREGVEVRIQGSTTLARNDEGETIGVISINRAVHRSIEIQEAPIGRGEVEIQRGIRNGEFEVYYQPIVTLDDGHVVAVEGLLRWNHPGFGLLEPVAFIDVAERSGLILELGTVVLDAACRQGAAWRGSGLDLDICINLSTKELTDPGLLDRVVAALQSTGMDPHHLWFEVTETALVKDVDRASALLHRLVALGIRISIDDFGTGWASLTYLREFSIHALKIDRSFVESVDHNLNDAAITRSILSLGAELGLDVVAEGVENAVQQDALLGLGARMAQGFLYGAATPAAAVPVHRARQSGAGRRGPRVEHQGTTETLSDVTTSDWLSGVSPHSSPSDVLTAALQGLLRIRSPQAAADLLQRTAERLGATLEPASEAGPNALPIDLALGLGPPVLPAVDPASLASAQLEWMLRRLVEDAQAAVDLLHHPESQ